MRTATVPSPKVLECRGPTGIVLDHHIAGAKRRLEEVAHRDSTKAAVAGGLVGVILGELASGRTRTDLGFAGTKETVLAEAMARKLASIAEKHTGTILTVAAAGGAGRSTTLMGGVGLVAGMAAAQVHADAPPLGRIGILSGKFENRGDLLERTWKAERIDIDDSMPSEEKFKILGDLINKLVVEGSYDPLVIEKSNEACEFVDGTTESYGRCVAQWVRDHVRYVLDEEMPYAGEGGVETEPDGSLEIFQEPGRTIESGVADCDCYTILILSMLRAQNVRGVARMISQDLVPGAYSHIFPVVPLDDEQGELVLDITPVKTWGGFRPMPIGWVPESTSSMTVLLQPLPRA